MDTEHESMVEEAEQPGDKDVGDEGEGNGDSGEAMEEIGDG